jgi:hypothetical protein
MREDDLSSLNKQLIKFSTENVNNLVITVSVLLYLLYLMAFWTNLHKN